jgi:hypothetical protein
MPLFIKKNKGINQILKKNNYFLVGISGLIPFFGLPGGGVILFLLLEEPVDLLL